METFQLKISEAEHRQRCEHLLEQVIAAGCSGVVLFDRDYIIYYTGFAFIPTERPIAFVMNRKGERGLFVPRMEVEHAQSLALIELGGALRGIPRRSAPDDCFGQAAG